MSWWTWLIIAGVLLIVEIFTQGFLVFWFSMGALITSIVSIFTSNMLIQILVFIISSTIMLFFTKTFSDKLRIKESGKKFNAETVIGKVGLVEQEVSELNVGVVKVDGTTWTAISIGDTIEVGREVVVKEIEGVKVVVERKTEI